MSDRKTQKIQAVHLRRLWHWVSNSTPGANTYFNLRAACREVGELLHASIGEDGLPGIPRELPVEGEVECHFTQEALWGFREALLQAISGKNNLQGTPAPFGSVEYLILPIADALGIAGEVCNNCDMLLGARG